MRIEVYADVVCPWCYIGVRRLERALAQRPKINAEKIWRPFQLQPGVSNEGLPWMEFVEKKFGGMARAQKMFEHVRLQSADTGIDFRFDRITRFNNTVDAHRLILAAAEMGRTWEMAGALFDAHFTQGKDLNDASDLASIAQSAGIDGGDWLLGDRYRSDVAASLDKAHHLGIDGVPFYVFDNQYGVSGAQPVDVLLNVMDKLGTESTENPV